MRIARSAVEARRALTSVYYGWRMVAAGVSIQILVGGLLMQSFGAYVAVLQSDLGWSRAALAGAFSLIHFVGGLSGPVRACLSTATARERSCESGSRSSAWE